MSGSKFPGESAQPPPEGKNRTFAASWRKTRPRGPEMGQKPEWPQASEPANSPYKPSPPRVSHFPFGPALYSVPPEADKAPLAKFPKYVALPQHNLSTFIPITYSNSLHNIQSYTSINQLNPVNTINTVNINPVNQGHTGHNTINPVNIGHSVDLGNVNTKTQLHGLSPMFNNTTQHNNLVNINPVNTINPVNQGHSVNPVNQVNPVNSINPVNIGQSQLHGLNPMFSNTTIQYNTIPQYNRTQYGKEYEMVNNVMAESNNLCRDEGYVSLSQVKGLGVSRKRNFEAMSEISDESSGSESAADSALAGYELKYFTPFQPKPPERFGSGHDLHELKVFLPLGVKAYLKSCGLSQKLAMGFETGPVRNGKLVLLLDLDNTLLHTASQSRLDMLSLEPCDFVDSLGDPELYAFTLPNFPNVNYFMKLRPCIREFIHILSLYYEMAIYTNATKEYADVVVSILDPDRSLFMDRIVARHSADEKDLLKSAARLYPELDSRFILAFDDRRDVWSDLPHNHVLKAEHYDFFESYHHELQLQYVNQVSSVNPGHSVNLNPVDTNTVNPDSVNSVNQDIVKLDNSVKHSNTVKLGDLVDKGVKDDYTINLQDEDVIQDVIPNTVPGDGEEKKIVDNDRHLKYMIRVFLEIHRRFFEDPFRNDVGAILESVTSEVLSGVGVLLTGYRKTTKAGNAVLHADCEQRQRENLSEMGASVVTRLNDPKLTHIMAGKNCTDNIVKSRGQQYKHVHKVHTLWLYSCRATFTRVDEALFDVDEVCKHYANEPPTLPNKDHWRFLLSKNTKEQVQKKAETQKELPTRIFMGTGPYSNGTLVLSSVEKILIRWDPAKTKLLQNSIPEQPKGNKIQRVDYTPFTNANNPNKFAY